MGSIDEFRMQPAEVVEATKQLDALAARVEQLMATEGPNLTVTAAGRDEVSGRVASTLNAVHEQMAGSIGQGSTQIKETAATLRAHTGDVVAAEHDFAV
jgi:ABC-type transporter Mla subunit MlaD